MSTILGLIGSARPWGNTEVLVRQALAGARVEGADVRMIRLADLDVRPCTGCMRCVIAGQPCPLDDDMAWLIASLDAADGIVLAAPTYWLGPAATVKLVLDRLLMVTGRLDHALPPPRPAATIATAGLQGWRGVVLPILNALALGLGFQPIDSFTAIAPGPGEVLLDEGCMEQALQVGRRVARGERIASAAPEGHCPICRCDAFILSGERAVCPICSREAAVETIGNTLRLRFEPVAEAGQRWTPEGLRAHMIDWVQATGPRFVARRDEIKARRAILRQTEIGWDRPPGVPEAPR